MSLSNSIIRQFPVEDRALLKSGHWNWTNLEGGRPTLDGAKIFIAKPQEPLVHEGFGGFTVKTAVSRNQTVSFAGHETFFAHLPFTESKVAALGSVIWNDNVGFMVVTIDGNKLSLEPLKQPWTPDWGLLMVEV